MRKESWATRAREKRKGREGKAGIFCAVLKIPLKALVLDQDQDSLTLRLRQIYAPVHRSVKTNVASKHTNLKSEWQKPERNRQEQKSVAVLNNADR